MTVELAKKLQEIKEKIGKQAFDVLMSSQSAEEMIRVIKEQGIELNQQLEEEWANLMDNPTTRELTEQELFSIAAGSDYEPPKDAPNFPIIV